MIITSLSGGLGNQMFQFAAAQALALNLNSPLLLDTSYFSIYQTNREFELFKVFITDFKLAKKEDLKKILGWTSIFHQQSFLRRLYKKIPFSKHWIVEPQINYWKEFSNLQSDCLLDGNWQSEKYFKHHGDIIRNSFQFNKSNFTNNDLLNKIRENNSVSIHIRRGDYVTNKTTFQYHGICDENYYLDAIKEIKKNVKNPKFYVFSDDISAAKKILTQQLSSCYFVENNSPTNNHFDMMLMSQCKHNIIANSTFSWWGAWLNTNPKKKVIAPKKWFARNLCDLDLIPEEWLRI